MPRQITNRIWLAVNQDLRCYWCNQVTQPKMGWQNSATIEHLMPKSEGGIDIAPNVVSACARCNDLRGTYCAEQFKLIAVQLEPDTKRLTEAKYDQRALRKKLGIHKLNKVDQKSEVQVKPLNADQRARNDLMLVKQALWKSPVADNPFEPGTRCHRLFERKRGGVRPGTQGQTQLETS